MRSPALWAERKALSTSAPKVKSSFMCSNYNAGILVAVPVYEYRCADCGRKFQALVGMVVQDSDEKCPNCGSTNTAKLMSRFQRGRNEDQRIDELADRMETMGEPDSPAQMREMMKEMGRAMDEDASDEMEELFEADMAGELDDED